MITKEELFDDNEYVDIVDDVSTECSQYGKVCQIIIPRSKDGYPESCDGSVFIEFTDSYVAKTAASALSGRKFGDRIVVVDYVSISIINSLNIIDYASLVSFTLFHFIYFIFIFIFLYFYFIYCNIV